MILSKPPFGVKTEGAEAQNRYAYKISPILMLFVQHTLDSLAANGLCGILLDEWVLFRTSDVAFV
ncbi:SAM-dependent DNA methyltransferase [Hymenobacter sp. BT186]|uniref:SAM-dependent DNA methyltransferase n=1 Tax=Hymenobacter telluris TaxID=2816474 RepID=A0A939EZP5_9BACT|nr:SAM-dependent DNA methyltransferase [Hymenobacter telluris]MBW3376853.1 N-6 DNA methylase [Hymenobacter norwichensis]